MGRYVSTMELLYAFFDNAGSAAAVGATAAAFVALAVLLNRFAPHNRKVLRRILTWWLLYLASALAHTVLGSSAPAGLSRFLDGSTDLFQAFTVVGLTSAGLFDLLLPALRIRVVQLTSDLLTGGAYAFVGAAVFSAAGLDLGSALAVSTVAAAILTISLQGTLGNVVGGVALQLEESVQVGDWIQLDNGRQGRVSAVRWRHTLLETRDGDTIVVPNAALLGGMFTLLGRRDDRRGPHRQWVYFHVDFRHPPAEVCQVVREALVGVPIEHVAANPAPDVICVELGRDPHPSFATYAVRYWLVDLAVDDPTSSVIRARVHAALRRADIPLALPTITEFSIGQGEDTEADRRERQRARALAALRGVELFQHLTEEECQKLAEHLVFAPFETGEIMTRQGAVAHWLYLMQSGEADIVTELNGARRVVSHLTAPDLFGEMGLLTGEPRLASVIACTPVVCYRLEKAAFEKVIKARPELAAALADTLAHRRMELLAVRENLGAEAREARERSERQRILERIRGFFGVE